MAENDGGSTEHRSHPRSQPVATGQTGIFARSGEYWTLGYGSTSFSLKDIKGLGYIQRLLQHPGEEFHSLDLLSGPGGSAAAELESADKPSLLSGATVSIGGLVWAGEIGVQDQQPSARGSTSPVPSSRRCRKFPSTTANWANCWIDL